MKNTRLLQLFSSTAALCLLGAAALPAQAGPSCGVAAAPPAEGVGLSPGASGDRRRAERVHREVLAVDSSTDTGCLADYGPLTLVQTELTRSQMDASLDHLRRLRAAPTQQRFGVYITDDEGRLHANPSSEDHAILVEAGPFRVATQGLRMGADYRMTEAVVLGGSLALERSGIDFSQSLSNQRGRGGSFTAYGSWAVTSQAYVSATLAYQGGHFDIHRDGGGIVSAAHTGGNGLGLSLAGGWDYTSGPWSVSPYVRFDSVTSRIDAFDESGSSDSASIGAQRLRSNTSSIGMQAQHSLPVSWGVLLSYARVELSRRSESVASSDGARLLSDGSPLILPTSADFTDRNYGAWAVGASTLMQHGLSAFVDWESSFGQRGYRTTRFVLGVRTEL